MQNMSDTSIKTFSFHRNIAGQEFFTWNWIFFKVLRSSGPTLVEFVTPTCKQPWVILLSWQERNTLKLWVLLSRTSLDLNLKSCCKLFLHLDAKNQSGHSKGVLNAQSRKNKLGGGWQFYWLISEDCSSMKPIEYKLYAGSVFVFLVFKSKILEDESLNS